MHTLGARARNVPSLAVAAWQRPSLEQDGRCRRSYVVVLMFEVETIQALDSVAAQFGELSASLEDLSRQSASGAEAT